MTISIRTVLFHDGGVYDLPRTVQNVVYYMDNSPMIEDARLLVLRAMADLQIASIPFNRDEFFLDPETQRWTAATHWIKKWGYDRNENPLDWDWIADIQTQSDFTEDPFDIHGENHADVAGLLAINDDFDQELEDHFADVDLDAFLADDLLTYSPISVVDLTELE